MLKPKNGVRKIESEVFHFDKPRFDPNGISDFYKPHAAVGHDTGGPAMSLTRQDAADECDVNKIMERFQATGYLPNVPGDPFYYDFTTLPTDMMDAMSIMGRATEAFMTLPATVRKQFDNDPAQFVNFASDEANLDQMRVWGLAPPSEKAPEPQPAPPVGDISPQPAPAPAPAPAPVQGASKPA